MTANNYRNTGVSFNRSESLRWACLQLGQLIYGLARAGEMRPNTIEKAVNLVCLVSLNDGGERTARKISSMAEGLAPEGLTYELVLEPPKMHNRQTHWLRWQCAHHAGTIKRLPPLMTKQKRNHEASQ